MLQKLETRQHVPLMWLVANLAFADLLFTSLTVLNVIDFFWRWVGGNGTCRLHGFLVEATYTTSITTLVLITFQRHKAVTDPFNARVQGWAKKEYIKPRYSLVCVLGCVLTISGYIPFGNARKTLSSALIQLGETLVDKCTTLYMRLSSLSFLSCIWFLRKELFTARYARELFLW